MIHLTSKERKSLLFVAIVLVLATLFQYLMPHKVKSDQYDYTLQDSLFKVFSADTLPPVEEQATEKTPTKPRRYKSKKKLAEKSIDINRADASDLEKMHGVGHKTAGNILDYRAVNGPFQKLEELTNVKRIGPKTLQKISPFVFIKINKSTTPDSVTQK